MAAAASNQTVQIINSKISFSPDGLFIFKTYIFALTKVMIQFLSIAIISSLNLIS